MFKEKNIVIVGATSGIGNEIAKQLSNENANIFSLSRSEINLNEINNLTHQTFDVLSQDLTGITLPDSIDGLVYCPGSINLKPFNRITEADFLQEYTLNALAAAKVVQLLLPKLKNANSASIVFFSTVAVGIGMPFHTSIAMAKGAVEGLTKSLAAEMAPKIRVNCIAPSLTQTTLSEKLTNTPEKIEAGNKRHPMARIGQATDIASVAKFLLSNESTWITGQVMHVDGGMGSIKNM